MFKDIIFRVLALMSKNHHYLPRYWPTWLAIFMLNSWSRTPWLIQTGVARLLANLLMLVARRRRRIVEVNLRLCFPEWDEATHRQKVKEVFFNNALGLVETSNAYRCPAESLRDKVSFTGIEVLRAAQAQGRGVLLVGAHYSHLDLGGALASLVCDPYAIYRPNNNSLMDKYIVEGRMRFMKGIIHRADMRSIARALKRNEVVWYPPDQDYGRQHAVFAPFFGVNAATITATSRLVKFNQSPVVILSCYRDDNSGLYHVNFIAAPVDFPSGDETRDAELINKAIEDCIRKAPTQYMWTHRRFKTQPDGRAKLYQ